MAGWTVLQTSQDEYRFLIIVPTVTKYGTIAKFEG